MALPHWPYATTDRPPLPAAIKSRNEDFAVDEVPAYEPCGDGDHLYVRVEKNGLTTRRVVSDVARALGVKPRNVGFAGMKDARGICRQTLSIEHCDPDRVARLDLPRIRVLGTARHRNKLRTGHLRGNRFTLRLRDTQPDRVDEVRETLVWLERHGAPNYYGPQRFGAQGDNWEVGRAPDLPVVTLRAESLRAVVIGRTVPLEPDQRLAHLVDPIGLRVPEPEREPVAPQVAGAQLVAVPGRAEHPDPRQVQPGDAVRIAVLDAQGLSADPARVLHTGKSHVARLHAQRPGHVADHPPRGQPVLLDANVEVIAVAAGLVRRYLVDREVLVPALDRGRQRRPIGCGIGPVG